MPILVVSQPNDDEARIVDAFEAGINAPQNDAQAVAAAIRTWVDDESLVEEQGRNARSSFEAYCTEKTAIQRYYDLLVDDRRVEPDPVAQQTARASRAVAKSSK
jgi:glycosyltransferase involved in cell wall biosynthesis